MSNEPSIVDDLDRILGTMAEHFARNGNTQEVAVLAHSKARISHWNTDWNIDQYRVFLEIPGFLFSQISDPKKEIEESLLNVANNIILMYPSEEINAFFLVSALTEDYNWREKAMSLVKGQGICNQGRVRSDNLAPLMCDGLLFRSQPEINLYRSLRSLGVPFAPLAVFVRGGETYRRIEPDFVLVKDGIVMVVEVDGDTVHKESPQEAHERLTMLSREGVVIERLNAKECDTPEKAKGSAKKILEIIQKIKANR